MSYILDALRKSETERRQGRVPDLGQQVQLIHKPRKKSVPVLVWVAAGLVLNAGVLAWIFWPQTSANTPRVSAQAPKTEAPATKEPANSTEPEAAPTPSMPEMRPEPAPIPASPVKSNDPLANAIEIPVPAASGSGLAEPVDSTQARNTGDERERPTVIVPSPRSSGASDDVEQAGVGEGESQAPHLVELPLSFQKSVQDLVFNSHIYASEPSSRRVMINDNYLRVGESFSGVTVERITEEGVELSKDGRRFRVGVVRNWVSPE